MSILRIRSLSELQPSMAARNRSKVSPDLAAGAAQGIPGEAAGSSAASVAGGNEPAPCRAGYILMPYPISANLYWRHFKGRTIVSKEAVAYKVRVANICRLVGMRMIEAGPVAVHILLHPRLTKKGEASLTRLDLGNTEKVLSDALNGIAWTDDKQLVRILLEVADPIDGGGVSISVWAA